MYIVDFPVSIPSVNQDDHIVVVMILMLPPVELLLTEKDPYYILVPRMTYLPLLPVKKHFESAIPVTDTSDNQVGAQYIDLIILLVHAVLIVRGYARRILR